MPDQTPDPMARLADTRDRLDRTTRRFGEADASRGEVSGSDSSGEVSVRIGRDGALLDLILGQRWMHHIEPDAFGGAVIEAYTQATIAAAEEWGVALAEQFDGPEPATRPLPGTHESTYGRLNDIIDSRSLGQQSSASLEAMAATLRDVRNDLDRVVAEAETLATTEHVGQSKGATVRVTGLGILASVEADPVWAASTNAGNLAQRTLQAYQAARRLALARTVDDVIAQSSVGELNRLAEDPEALAQRFGLV